jgi:hypothetical protein
MATWSTWQKWNGSMEQTLSDAQHAAAGDASLAEAKKKALKAGSPGVLTVDVLADHRMLGRVWVLSAAELHERFGSKTPARRALEADHDAFVRHLEPGQAVAVTAYLRGQPAVVLFAGNTDR